MKLRETILLHDVLAAINRWEIHHCRIEWQLLSDEQVHAYLRYAGATRGSAIWGLVEEMTGRPITNFEESTHGEEASQPDGDPAGEPRPTTATDVR